MYTRSDLPPSYSGSLFRERGDDAPEPFGQAESTEEQTVSEGVSDTPDAGDTAALPTSARARQGKGSSLLSFLGSKRLFGFDFEDLLILALILILFAEDGDTDLLPILLILLFTGK